MPLPIVIANWKMNPLTFKEAERLLRTVKKGLSKVRDVEVVICPPFTYILNFKSSASNLSLGGQDLFWENKGAYTGEISSLILKDCGCQYVIIGHSERREYLVETNEMINKKVKAALKNRLNPILCLGEKAEQREEASQVIRKQLESALENIPASRLGTYFCLAYEPIWAIGTGQTPSSDEIMSTVLLIRQLLTKMYDRKTAEQIRILYGGSLTAQKAEHFVKEAGLAGFLVGGASLNATEFISIVKTTAKL
ncbi:MAG TPA: triose-phosphate isomerase [Candidatus Portnoybacteria bacterium]|nr:triose-phosphate isomerase [Candidatus Portnoybacteria bacterium]